MKITTCFWPKPIPDRRYDWSAIDSDTYDADCDQDGYFSHDPVGYGRTEAEAIQDLKDQLEARSDDSGWADYLNQEQPHD
jgi:hypothetical protein